MSAFQTRQLLWSLLVGGLIAGASVIAYINSERDVPFAATIALSILTAFVFPGYTLSAYISNNIHNANLILAALINWVLYSAIILWVVVRKSRKRKDNHAA
jgi:amino acid transporter